MKHAAEALEILPEVGALSEWHAELAQGKRTKYDFDALFRAACAEKNARDALKDGLISTANDYRREAARIILEAANRESGKAPNDAAA